MENTIFLTIHKKIGFYWPEASWECSQWWWFCRGQPHKILQQQSVYMRPLLRWSSLDDVGRLTACRSGYSVYSAARKRPHSQKDQRMWSQSHDLGSITAPYCYSLSHWFWRCEVCARSVFDHFCRWSRGYTEPTGEIWCPFFHLLCEERKGKV